jgi:hypothetical protein
LLILDCMVQFEEYIPVMNILLWILQGVLAVINAMHGWLYVTWSPATDQRMQQRNPGTKPLGWQEVTDGLPGRQGSVVPVLASNPDEPHTFYLLSNKGLYRSGDAGLSWEALPIAWREEYLTQHQQALLVSTL